MNEEIQEFQLPLVTLRVGEVATFLGGKATETDCGVDFICKIKIEEILERVS